MRTDNVTRALVIRAPEHGTARHIVEFDFADKVLRRVSLHRLFAGRMATPRFWDHIDLRGRQVAEGWSMELLDT